ncbi:MAG: flagellar export protein FliJ [Anaerolineae bacterium]|nr:flagellar export protein FliJ [Anaerolineae bacterium]
MARPGFRLQPVLNYREQIVELRQQELAALERSLQVERMALTAIQGRIYNLATDIQNTQQRSPLDCVLILNQYTYMQQLQNREQEQKTRVADLTKLAEAKRTELAQALQEKQTIEKLRERFVIQQKEEDLRQEARTLDEISVVRFLRESRVEEPA